MAKKKQKVKSKPQPTAQQLSRVRQFKRRQRITRLVALVFVCSVIAFIGFGYYTGEVRPRNEPAIEVNDTVFDMGYYIDTLKLYPQQMAAEAIITNELLRQGAAMLGITVDSKEVKSKLKELEIPSNMANQDVVRVSLLQTKLEEHFDSQIPTTAEQVKIQYMLLDDMDTALEARQRWETGEDFADLAKELAAEPLGGEPGEAVWLPRGLAELKLGSNVIEETAFSLSKGEISPPAKDSEIQKKLGYWIIKVIGKTEENIEAQAILLGSLQEALGIEVTIREGEEDFATLANEYSQHYSKNDSGKLGEITKGTMSEAFDEVAFSLELGKISSPVRDETVVTKGGYWLIEIVDREDSRELDSEARGLLINKSFNEWIEDIRANSKIENYLDEEKTAWAAQKAGG